jgi:predicted RNase H-like nuclease
MLGIDLAWGERMPDGVALIEATRDGATWRGGGRVQGDAALTAWVSGRIPEGDSVFAAVDAPLVCPNETGARPVDRETHRWFGRQHAGCHPSNARLCRRPLRIAGMLRGMGFDLGWDLRARLQAAEVYPHPAMVRWFGLERVIKYKRPPVAERRREFARYRRLLRGLIEREFKGLAPHAEMEALLDAEWSKAAEDQLDAFLCALIAWWHWRDGGLRTQALGDVETGFLLVPTGGGR